MSWLSPFLTPASFVELGIVAAVFCYLCLRFRTQNANLIALDADLQAERAALKAASDAMEAARVAGENAQTRVLRLNQVLIKGSLVWKRAQLTSRNRSRRPEATLPQRFYDVTEEARYWQSAFVFIGLTGTLICLGLAVAYLTVLVGRNGAETSRAGGLKEVVSHMTAVFGGMGAAFLSTASGVGFTLTLAGRISVQERGWERLRDEVEEFSLLEIEPLSAQMFEKTEELPRLEAAVARMEGIALAFNSGLQLALTGLETTGQGANQLREANELAARNLASSAEAIEGASHGFTGAAGLLSSRLEGLETTLNQHGATFGESAREWNTVGRTSLDLLREATEKAAHSFLELGEMRRELSGENARVHAALLESTGATQGLAREMQASALSLGQEIARTNQSSLSMLREEVGRGIVGVSDAIERGVHSEEQLLSQFRLVLESMGEYAMRVEETIGQLPASLGTEPLLVFENNQDAALMRATEGISHVRGEISALRTELREAIVRDLPGALGQSLGTGLTGVNQGVETLREELRGSHTNARNLGDNVAGLAAQVNGLSAQVTQLRASAARLDKGIVITWPWSRS